MELHSRVVATLKFLFYAQVGKLAKPLVLETSVWKFDSFLVHQTLHALSINNCVVPWQRVVKCHRISAIRMDGGTGRRTGLKILYQKWCEGSIPSLSTNLVYIHNHIDFHIPFEYIERTAPSVTVQLLSWLRQPVTRVSGRGGELHQTVNLASFD